MGGHEVAMYNIALCYRKGEGVRRSAQNAVRWLTKSAEEGYAPAFRDLGVAYHEGSGVRKDDSIAVWCYRQAAAQSDTMAMYNLGLCYAVGDGVKASKPSAMRWFRKAAQLGHRKARTQIGQLSKSKAVHRTPRPGAGASMPVLRALILGAAALNRARRRLFR
jgi:TPR repeat protein